MSTPPPPDADRRKSLAKYVKRMSSVFKRERHASHAAPDAASPVAEPALPVVEQRGDAATKQIVQQPVEAAVVTAVETPVAAPVDVASTPTANTPALASPAIDRRAMQQDRARALFAKYGLTLESHEWFAAAAPAPLVPRVEKPIRMRVHRSCHVCGHLYGHDNICVQCEHKRCKYCPRYPKKKTPADKANAAAKQKDQLHDAAADQPSKKKLFTVTTRHGNQLTYQPATQRVRRTCHKCDALFVPATATTCDACSHVRCTKCPREPAKRSKWPAGYPGDAAPDSGDDDDVEDDDYDNKNSNDQFRRIWRKPRRIVRWECEQCHGLFRQGSPQCPGCQHERCDQCTRSPVKKPRHDDAFDPIVVAAVEAKLRALGLDDDPPTSDPEHV